MREGAKRIDRPDLRGQFIHDSSILPVSSNYERPDLASIDDSKSVELTTLD
jgi:hypothetical protein